MKQVLAPVIGFVAIAGCTQINEDIGAGVLPALSPTDEGPPPGDHPSISSFDRRGWPLISVKVPRKQVANRRTYVTNLHWPKQPEAWAVEYPSATEALDATPVAATDVAHGALAPVHAAGLSVWWPIDMAVLQHWPWNVVRSPTEPYELTPPPQPMGMWRWIETTPRQVEWNDPGGQNPQGPDTP